VASPDRQLDRRAVPVSPVAAATERAVILAEHPEYLDPTVDLAEHPYWVFRLYDADDRLL